MKRKVIVNYVILIVIFSLLMKISHGDLDDDLQHYYSFDSDLTDDIGDINGTAMGTAGQTAVDSKLGGGAVYSDGTNDNAIHFDGAGVVKEVDEFTHCAWYKSDDDTAWETVFSEGCSSSANCIYSHRSDNDGDGKLQMYLRDQNSATKINGVEDNMVGQDNTWHFKCHTVWASGTYRTYTDGNISASGSYSGGAYANFNRVTIFALRMNGAPVHESDGYIDEYGIWNRSLSHSEIGQLYYNGTGCNPVSNPTGCSVVASNPSMTVNVDLTNSTENYNDADILIRYNASFSDHTRDDANCTLYVDYLANMTDSNVNLSINQDFNYTFPVDKESWVTFQVNCSNFESNDSSLVYWYNVDVVQVDITTDYTNKSRYNDSQTVSFNNTVEDPNLFAYNYTWFNESGHILKNVFAENLTITKASNLTTFQLNASWVGNNTMRLEAWDSHTKVHIPDYPWEKYLVIHNNKTYKGIRFKNNYLNLSSDDYQKIDDFSLVKNVDRYKFVFNFNTIGQNIDIFIQSKKGVKYLPYSEYSAHFIIGFKHWIDFKSDDVEDLQVTYLENFNAYRVRFKPLQEVVTFESIGDLNYNTLTYVIDVQTTPVPPTDLELALDILNDNLEDINDNLEGINLIPVVMLYMLFMYMGWVLVNKYNMMSGLILWVMSLGLDFAIVNRLWAMYYQYASSSTGQGLMMTVFVVFLVVWIFLKMLFILSSRATSFVTDR